MIAFLVVLVLSGLLIGALGRLALPGPDPMTIGQTILVGIAGSLVAGLIGRLLFGGFSGGLILAVLCSMGIVYLIRRSREGAAGPGYGTRRFRDAP